MSDEVNELLQLARRELLAGIHLSKQAAYSRRAPEPASLPHFSEAQQRLNHVLAKVADHREALVMMSQIRESVLDYHMAMQYLERAFEAGEPRNNKSLKRLATLRECAEEWETLGISPEMLRDLGDHLESLGVGPANRSLECTRAWLKQNVGDEMDRIVQGLAKRGDFTDFQVLANIVNG